MTTDDDDRYHLVTTKSVEHLDARIDLLFRYFRWALVGFGILVFSTTFFAVVVRNNSTSIDNLRQTTLTIQAAQAQSSQQFQGFLKSFVAEQNYICQIISMRAEANDLPPPPLGICNVKLPGG